MKILIKSFLFLLLLTQCSSPDSSSTEKFSKDHPVYYFELGKQKERLLKERLYYLTEAEQRAIALNLDSIVIKSLSLKAYLYKKENYLDSVLPVAKKMLTYAIKAKDSASIGKAYFKIGENFLNKNINDSAFYYLDKSKYVYTQIKDSSEAGKKLDRMARILIYDGNYNLGESLLVEALEYLEPIKDSVGLTSVYLNLAIDYRKQKNYNQAKIYINKAYEYSTSAKAKKILENTELLILRENEEFGQVIKRYSALIKDKNIAKNKKEYARVLDNFAYTKWLADSNVDVERELLESLRLRDSLKNASGLIASNEHLMFFYSQKDSVKAIDYAKKLYKLTVEQNNIEDRLDAIEYLRKHSPNETIKYTNLELQLKDSLFNEQKLSGSRYAAMIYDNNKLEKALITEKKNKELIDQKRITQNTIYSGIGIFTILCSIFLFFYLQTKHKKEKVLERHTTEKRLSKKLHDEVGNDVFYLMSQLQNENNLSKNSTGTSIISGLDAVYHKVRDFSRNHTIEIGPEYGDELLSLLNSYGNEHIKVFTNTLKDDFWTSVADYKKVELYWVLKELLTNMKKHSQATIVSVGITKEKKNIIVKYTDNGIGTDLNAVQKRKNGLYNVENRIKDMKGTITFETKPQKGFKSIIEFAP
ncbi:tetratricopeptide repeat-containing sensor histidine kinase [uncultured Aquimarina sp.]|uniref:ATP-binding protein n=1 Tax=uncultured Aquimarina sp. TaxID=575652 RepID=UPI00262D1AFB|nr:tetratricopeptide repeat-containing sensor histidine kinase [uncultured Aquimarina sp.]